MLSFLVRCCLSAACLLPLSSAHAQWATLNWTIAETLLAIDAPLSGTAQHKGYHEWVGEPGIPDGVADLGLRSQPNLELMAQSPPTQTFISPMFASLTERLESIAPVTSFSPYSPGTHTWQEIQTLTSQLGELTGHRLQAAQLINETHTLLETLGQQRPEAPPLMMVQFMDARHVRVFGDNSLYNAVLERINLTNAWDRPTNAWGFSLVGIEALYDYPEATLVVVEPLPAGVAESLAKSGLWQHLPSVKNATLLRLPPVWSFGALPSAQHFARELVAALMLRN
ncbi:MULTISPECIES: ABC transporter substrate-binding protein [unclassified Halomonas]|uniref:ABC transporter substrate-binding protein n=1 Tax=unclassified Halomonas TaxID=2609666 RepID=UPI001CF1D726|nr:MULTISPECIES: ABC transporter substrate-binding protein [unclassified Halomonas]MCA8862696.1 ABC transporter substrate-binding protein [Halomonas sp. SBBP1]UZH12432.1 ABC transporter substrate-binding protein [Halomonas sp. BDJS001]